MIKITFPFYILWCIVHKGSYPKHLIGVTGEDFVEDESAVSYTHLDVYKRQRIMRTK